MRRRHALLLLALALPACTTPGKGDKPKEKKEKPIKPTIPDASSDTSFQAFIGRLKLAVAKKDSHAIAETMAEDFGWRWEQPQPGNPFAYWDETNTWHELEMLLHERFTPSGDYMVSPPAFAADPGYRGYRCGMRMIGGKWRFVYFVSGEDPIPQ